MPLLRKNRAPQFSGFVETTKKASYASFVLEPGLSRSGGGYAQISVPPGTDVVRLELALPSAGGDAQTYQATLGTPEKPALWKGAAPREESSAVASVPSSVLLPGDYALELEAGGKEVATYSFRVTR
jgi:hypothetical protein